MKRRILFLALPLGLVFFAVTGVLLWLRFHPAEAEPLIQGRTLSYWASVLKDPPPNAAPPVAASANPLTAPNAGGTLVVTQLPAGFFGTNAAAARYFSILQSGSNGALPVVSVAVAGPSSGPVTANVSGAGGAVTPAPTALAPIAPNDALTLLNALEIHDDPFRRAYRTLWPNLPEWMQQRWPPSADPGPIRTNAALVLTLTQDTAGNINLLKHYPGGFLRKFAAEAVAFNANSTDKSATAALAEALTDKDAGVRGEAALGLGLYGRDKTAYVVPLLKCLHDWDAKVRFYAAVALSEIEAGRAAALPEILKGVKSRDIYVHNAAASALAQHYPEEAEKQTRQ